MSGICGKIEIWDFLLDIIFHNQLKKMLSKKCWDKALEDSSFPRKKKKAVNLLISILNINEFTYL